MSKNCNCSLASAAFMVTLCANLQKFLALFMLSFLEATLNWTDTNKAAMRSMCTALCSHPVLGQPDLTKPYQIKSDVYDTAVGGVIT